MVGRQVLALEILVRAQVPQQNENGSRNEPFSFCPEALGGMSMSSNHTIRAYKLVQSYHARGACEVSPFPDSAQNAFGFPRTEGASQYEAQNSARAKREQVWRMWRNPKQTKGFSTIFLERIAEPFARGGGSMFSGHSTQGVVSQSFFFCFAKVKR